MEERKFVKLKKEEFKMKESVKRELGKGKISSIKVEYTPVGEKITVGTTRPGFIIGRKGERIERLTNDLKNRFDLENPHIDIKEIEKPEFDSQYVADEIATGLEKVGSLKFKGIAYKMLNRIMGEGAMGAEIRLSGKLPSERSRTWRFKQGYLKKTGETAKVVDMALTEANTLQGTVGVYVSIMSPDTELHDRVDIGKALKNMKEEKEEVVEDGKKDGKGEKGKSEGKKGDKKEKEKDIKEEVDSEDNGGEKADDEDNGGEKADDEDNGGEESGEKVKEESE